MKYFPKTMTPLSVAIGMSVLAGHASAQVLPVSDVHCQVMQDSNTLNPQGPVGCDRLRLVTFPFASLDGPDGEGSVMVMDAFAEQVDDLFIALYQRRFPLQTALGMEHFNGDDAASMAANNTSAFNGRVIEGSANWSLHAYGAAIDLNPVQNPFLAIAVDGTASIDPVASARSYVNRMSVRAEKPVRVGMAEEVIDLFAERGFLHWGGYWNYPVDYQHFEVAPRRFIEYLANAEPEQAREDFLGYVQMYGGCMAEEAVLEHAAQRAQCVGRVLDYYRQWPL
ncbi:M15 family metallopeptidase [Pseudomonas abieticivorans]|uniref:M15 family metallopeptidase n=1 Tax=Pseudomonas abieticivorans TaxID=2931382 RepID=UPI0020BF88DA|nr:M15 family metallopeptidase [Pseudomonas sp. PIA16]